MHEAPNPGSAGLGSHAIGAIDVDPPAQVPLLPVADDTCEMHDTIVTRHQPVDRLGDGDVSADDRHAVERLVGLLRQEQRGHSIASIEQDTDQSPSDKARGSGNENTHGLTSDLHAMRVEYQGLAGQPQHVLPCAVRAMISSFMASVRSLKYAE